MVEEIISSLENLDELKQRVTELGMIGSPDDSDLEQLELAKQAIKVNRDTISGILLQIEPNSIQEEEAEKLRNLLIDCCIEGDTNIDLINSMFTYWPNECSDLINEERLIATSCADGHPLILEKLLSYPNIQFDIQEVVSMACYNSTYRVPLLKVLMDHSDKIPLHQPDVAELCRETLQEFIEDVSKQRNNNEEWDDRIKVLRMLFNNKVLKLDLNNPDGYDQTIFTRAINSGDVEIMQLISEYQSLNFNEILPDGSTYLMRAVFLNQKASVEWLLKQPNVQPDLNTPMGTAMDVAKIKSTPEIQNLLQEKLEQNKKNSLPKTPTEVKQENKVVSLPNEDNSSPKPVSPINPPKSNRPPSPTIPVNTPPKDNNNNNNNNGFEAENLAYIRFHHIPRLYDDMMRFLLHQRPYNPAWALSHFLQQLSKS
eukprot:NODE_3112_length_1422_cov_6.103156_g2703_i0.p1 GENE.NODE_3112_length_1422_cov_6.103156_g2703_i0~~NODE_3112_length_1422_cov_6.103156_g2703_i0.p1  ORF type:complete len:427 (-),score=91.58 NODE_3112_length_1422_cov_6.103156_g2703_i0:41-1321(-)